MAAGLAASRQVARRRSGVRLRAFACLFAALLALFHWAWLPSVALHSHEWSYATGATIGGVQTDLVCHGRGAATVVLVRPSPITEAVIDDAAQAELARYVRFCALSFVEVTAHHSTLALSEVLPVLLSGETPPAPYVLISAQVSPETALAWVTEPIRQRVAGFVLIHPPQEPSSLVVSMNGDQRPLPVGDRDAMVLAILSLFWPPDDA